MSNPSPSPAPAAEPRRRRWLWPVLLVLGVVAASLPLWPRPSTPTQLAPEASVQPAKGPVFADFVGSEACAECHQEQYKVWKRSTHGRAGGVPGDQNAKMIARFDGKPLQFKDAVVTPFRSPAGQYAFRIELPRQPPFEVRADFVVGGGHMHGGGTQTFFGGFPDGTLRFLPFDFIRQEDLWFVQLKDASWTPISAEISLLHDLANWPPHRALGTNNSFDNCQNCHGSQIDLRKRPGGPGYETRFMTLQINCESCHGPGRRHIELVQQPGAEQLEDIGMTPLETVTKDQSLEICFQCHATKNPLRTETFFPGHRFADYYSLKLPLLDGSPLLVDGRVRAFGYQLNHLYSDCYLNGSMTCVDCHDPHSQDYRDVFFKPLVGKFDDGQCTSCHASKAVDPESHSHHKPGTPGSLCTDCHMPFLQHQIVGKSLRFARSDHTIPIPRPAFDASLGIENACAKCHADRSTEDLQATVKTWYGEIKPHAAAVQALIQADQTSDPAPAMALLLNPSAEHAMAQMAGLFGFLRRFPLPDPDAPEPGVVDKLRAFAASDDLDLRAVAMMALDIRHGQDRLVQQFLAAQMAKLGADEAAVKSRWANSAVLLGGYFAEAKDLRSARVYMENAIKIDPDDATLKSHLAMTYMQLGDGAQAIEQLHTAIEQDPDCAAFYFQLTQFHLQQKQLTEAIEALEQAVEHAPMDRDARQFLKQLKAKRRGK